MGHKRMCGPGQSGFYTGMEDAATKCAPSGQRANTLIWWPCFSKPKRSLPSIGIGRGCQALASSCTTDCLSCDRSLVMKSLTHLIQLNPAGYSSPYTPASLPSRKYRSTGAINSPPHVRTSSTRVGHQTMADTHKFQAQDPF